MHLNSLLFLLFSCVLVSCGSQDDEPFTPIFDYPIAYQYSSYTVEESAFYIVGEEDLQTHTPSQAFQQHIEQNLIQDLLPELSLEFSLRELVLTSDSTCIFTTFDVATDSTFEISGSYIREGNKLLFPNPSVPYTSFLSLEEDDSAAYWCEYYFSRAYINQNSEEAYEGFQQFPCFILDELEPIDDYIQNYAQFEADDVLGVVIVNHVLNKQ